MKIPTFVIVYHDLEMTKRSIESLAKDKRLEIHVIHNRSDNFSAIADYIWAQNELGIIEGFLNMDANYGSEAFRLVMKQRMSGLHAPFIICTDGDVEHEDISGVVDKQMAMLNAFPEVFCACPKVSKENLSTKNFPEAQSWLPPVTKGKYFDYGQGPHHFMMMRTNDLEHLIAYLDANDFPWEDTCLGSFARSRNQYWAFVSGIPPIKHLGWDAYQDLNHPYTRQRLSKSLKETWGRKTSLHSSGDTA